MSEKALKTGDPSTPAHKMALPIELYQSLLVEVTERGLFKRTYWHYALTGGVSILGVGASLFALTASDNAVFQIVNALVFSFFSVQIGMIGHDLSHEEVFTSNKRNRFWGMLAWGLLGGLSESRWFSKHNAHHKNPNHIGHDPDLEIPFVFSGAQAARRSPFYKKWVFPYQHIMFWPALAFVYPYNIAYSMKFIFSNMTIRSIIELLLMAAHFIITIGLPFYFLPLPIALLFLTTAFVIIGAYLGVVFAPNHKGEAMLDEDETFNWAHQITLTRNLHSSWLASYVFGGLNFQIEHHLFPTMPRFNYGEAQTIVREFCVKHGLRYHTTSWLGSMVEIHRSLKEEARMWTGRA
ncbi:MAG: acyl-CoA desaturase [Parcubacteria group bacterium]|nr:acyl-CoA desaturase [Parcubacteria group bacterium]